MCIIKSLAKKLHNIRKSYKNNKWLYRLVPIILSIIYMVYYFPIYGIVGVSDEKLLGLGDEFYAVIDPFWAAPVIAGLLLIVIFVFYKGALWRIIFSVEYIVSLFFSLVALMGYTDLGDLKPYVIHVFVIGIIIFVLNCERI